MGKIKQAVMAPLKRVVTAPLEGTGIVLNGPNPWDPQIKRDRAFLRVFLGGSIGLADSYRYGDWNCIDLAGLFARLAESDSARNMQGIPGIILDLQSRFMNLQDRGRSTRVAVHYNIGSAFYSKWLGSTMFYTCAYLGRDATTLYQAQRDKAQIVGEKAGLKPGDRVLDVGCGFGSLGKYLAQQFGVTVVGITIAEDQRVYALEACAGLPVENHICNYMDLIETFGLGSFDHVVSVGMFEAVGPKNFTVFMEQVMGVLKPGGRFVLHTIIGARGPGQDPWISRDIFPGGYLPTVAQIREMAGRYAILDEHFFGKYYYWTLCEWEENFRKAIPELLLMGYDEIFCRMWRYYLLQCAGLFRSGVTDLGQFVISHEPMAYVPVR